MNDYVRPYNPRLLGISASRGPITPTLQEARERFGRLPSELGLMPRDGERPAHPTLNLEIGRCISDLLSAPGADLKAEVYGFFETWHRDLRQEFGIDIHPLINLNSPTRVQRILTHNRTYLESLLSQTPDRLLLEGGWIKRQVLNSIPPEHRLEKFAQILHRRQREHPSEAITSALAVIAAHRLQDRCQQLLGPVPFPDIPLSQIEIYADEISQWLGELQAELPLRQLEALRWCRGEGLEFRFAPRDRHYLRLGTRLGDCTAAHHSHQADPRVENIYWTLFAWILDRNYQILEVHFDGQLVLKAHLLPLFYQGPQGLTPFLALDAIETGTALRDDVDGPVDTRLSEQRERILFGTLKQVLALAEAMGLEQVYGERFSNTPWVRELLSAQEEIALRPERIHKLDELEDLLELASRLCQRQHLPPPEALFMELQCRNTQLLGDHHSSKVKRFALLRGDRQLGEPLKQVFGV